MTEATPETPAASAAAPANVLVFRIPNTETDISVDIGAIPAETRMDFLKQGLEQYIKNATNQAAVRAKKANEPFDLYDAAMTADPLQTAVAKPTGERTVADLLGTAAAARQRLYDGAVKKMGDSTPRVTADPLTRTVTDSVVRELFEKRKAAGEKVKFTDITGQISKAGGGIKYLEAMIEAKVAAAPEAEQAATRATLVKFMDERYIKPARMLIGGVETKGTKDVSLL